MTLATSPTPYRKQWASLYMVLSGPVPYLSSSIMSRLGAQLGATWETRVLPGYRVDPLEVIERPIDEGAFETVIASGPYRGLEASPDDAFATTFKWVLQRKDGSEVTSAVANTVRIAARSAFSGHILAGILDARPYGQAFRVKDYGLVRTPLIPPAPAIAKPTPVAVPEPEPAPGLPKWVPWAVGGLVVLGLASGK